jgi:hypothetical protein
MSYAIDTKRYTYNREREKNSLNKVKMRKETYVVNWEVLVNKGNINKELWNFFKKYKLYVINAHKNIDDDEMNLNGIFGMLCENKEIVCD